MTDESIISSILSGDQTGYTVLMERHKGRLFYYVFKMVHNTMDAEDLTMIAFQKAFSKLDTWKQGSCKFSTWLFTIAKNTVLDFFITRAKRINNWVEFEKCVYKPDYLTPEQKILHDENVAIIEDCIGRLKPKRAELIRLKADGYKDEQIADILHITHLAVRTKLNRTRNQLKSLLYEKANPVINYYIA